MEEEQGGAARETNNNSFARKLGSADKKTRDKGLALLVLWLSCQQVSPPFLHFSSFCSLLFHSVRTVLTLTPSTACVKSVLFELRDA
jgi:hypothetical protein